MKSFITFLITALFPFFYNPAHATDYYFSQNGNDNNSGTSESNPFQTLTKASSLLLQPGDRLFFKRGEVFRGTLQVFYSGTESQPIILTSYGTGTDAVISGSEFVNNWTSVGNGIYKAACPVYPQMVFDNSEPQTLARFPNKGFYFTDAANGNNGFSDNDLPDKGSLYVGAGVHIRTARFRYDERIVSTQSGGYLGFDKPTAAAITAGAGYYLTGKLEFVDEAGEYYYNSSEQQLYYKSKDGNAPENNTIEVSRYDNGIEAVSSANLIIKNLIITHQQNNGVRILGNATDNLTIDKCTFQQIYLYAITGGNKNGLSVTNNSFSDIWSGGIFIGGITNVDISNNTFDRIGIAAPGRATDGLISYKCLYMNGSSGIISNNIIDSIGNNGIEFNQNTIIEKNIISKYCMVTDDGAGIVAYGEMNGIRNGTGCIVRNNIVHDPVGNSESFPFSNLPFVNGIGMDDNSGNAIIENNTVYNVIGRGISIHNSSFNQVRNNTVFNCNNGSLVFEHDYNGSMLSGNVASGNILYNIHANENAMKLLNWHQSETGLNFGSYSNNYYINPYYNAAVYTAEFGNSTSGNFGLLQKDYSVSGWRGLYDAGAKASPGKLDTFKIISTNSNDLVTNGTFDQNMDGWDCYADNFTCNSSWQNSGRLDGGYVKANSPYFDYGNFFNTQLISLQKGKEYLLSYSVVGDENKIAAFNIQDRSNWAQLTPRVEKEVSTTRLEQKILLTPNENTTSGQLTFYIGPEYTTTFYLDNIKLQEVTTEVIDPLTQNLFFVNPTNQIQTVSLPGIFLDVDGNTVSGQIELQPFTSRVFMASKESVLPLHIVDISAVAMNNDLSRIDWTIVDADAGCKMELQKSTDGVRFKTLGQIAVESNQKHYQYNDSNFTATGFYRIKINCVDEHEIYSKTVTLVKSSTGFTRVYPNPITGNKLNVVNNEGFNAAKLYNSDGRKLLEVPVQKGSNVLELPSNISTGIYMLVLTGKNMTKTVKLLKE